MNRPWDPDFSAEFSHRPGLSPSELGETSAGATCPDVWELTNGDFAVIGRRGTDQYGNRLPSGAAISVDEDIVIVPRSIIMSAAQHLV